MGLLSRNMVQEIRQKKRIMCDLFYGVYFSSGMKKIIFYEAKLVVLSIYGSLLDLIAYWSLNTIFVQIKSTLASSTVLLL